ncbi:PhoH family protein [Blochmannia endosymbiont of Camponotus (Colobopsis) obliquus]|uniref:PhoH family protein n=1 Tax=Blochmannia endosymbiont of Camponotus (Colobopsis) obliquus TaxID=1505597 RepID=UPI00061A7BD5|nr:PhoH family protein [Blochmannia endosymbiont of Camponotus (Colobopsis) obliquus]AKC60483.1 phoH-like protein [Blochmannia endosymbiont of Camponotus (Colobopsis) obliquus]
MTKHKLHNKKIILEPIDNNRLMSLCGPLDNNIKELEHQLDIIINRFNNIFQLIGNTIHIDIATTVITSLYLDTAPLNGIITNIGPEQIHLAIIKSKTFEKNKLIPINHNKIININTKHSLVKPKTINQMKYITHICNHDIIFGIGPAGTGKTYLAVATAIQALEHQNIHKIILTRPAVEVDEKLGFLPGDLYQKIHPYLYPLYDAMFKIMGHTKVKKLIERNIIEIAPLAYMRGRTFNHAFILLDEGQNTTIAQMKMFLTRIGFNSKVIITGDITQIDLPQNQPSGLCHAMQILTNIKGISFNIFHNEDVIRHPIVKNITNAYEYWEKNNFLKTKHR